MYQNALTNCPSIDILGFISEEATRKAVANSNDELEDLKLRHAAAVDIIRLCCAEGKRLESAIAQRDALITDQSATIQRAYADMRVMNDALAYMQRTAAEMEARIDLLENDPALADSFTALFCDTVNALTGMYHRLRHAMGRRSPIRFIGGAA